MKAIKGKKHNPVKIKHAKRRGEWAELCFMQRAIEEGLQVSKPWGEASHYDAVVEEGQHFLSVQVKSTTFEDRGGWSCSVRGSNGPYAGDEFDYLAVFVVPIEVWYIIPGRLVGGQGSVALYPKLKKAKYEKYREAWGLLKGKPTAVTIHAVADDSGQWSQLESWRD